jgi:hypothetical protein
MRSLFLKTMLVLLVSVGLGCSDDSTSGPDGSTGDGPGNKDGIGQGDGTADVNVICKADQSAQEAVGDDPSLAQTVTGDGGTFSDTCDGGGNLKEYLCEVKTECGPGPNPWCDTKQTGKVISKDYDCNGGCKSGACDSRCPAPGQQVTYESVDADGNPVLVNTVDGRKYSKDVYDCKKAPFVGEKGRVASLGLKGKFCTGGEIGNIGIAIEGVQAPTGGGQHCTYLCSITK